MNFFQTVAPTFYKAVIPARVSNKILIQLLVSALTCDPLGGFILCIPFLNIDRFLLLGYNKDQQDT